MLLPAWHFSSVAIHSSLEAPAAAAVVAIPAVAEVVQLTLVAAEARLTSVEVEARLTLVEVEARLTSGVELPIWGLPQEDFTPRLGDMRQEPFDRRHSVNQALVAISTAVSHQSTREQAHPFTPGLGPL